jgi:tetratricopeptide (TPR) repeat protein
MRGAASGMTWRGLSAVLSVTALSAGAFAEGPSAQTRTPPPGQAEAAQGLKGGPETTGASVPVRLGTHGGFTRVVFDWQTAIDYGVEQKGGTITIRFRRAARLDLGSLTAGDSPAIVRAEVKGGGNDTVVKIETRAGTRVRHFRSGTGIVLDMLDPGQAADADRGTPLASQPAAKASPEIAANAVTGDIKPAGSPRIPAAPKKPRSLAAKPQAAAETPRAAGSAPSGKTGPAPPEAENQAAPKALKAPERASPPGPRPLVAGEVENAARPADGIAVALSLQPREPMIRFHWEARVGAAVFIRGGHLWAVFDRRSGMVFEGWEKRRAKRERRAGQPQAAIPPWAAGLGEPGVSQVSGHTVFRMRLPRGIVPRVAKEDETWVVTLDQEIAPPVAGIAVTPHFSPVAGARLSLSVAEAGQASAIRDPEAGDLVWVVPVREPGKGIGLSRTFVDVELFATAQGIAGRAMRDGVVFNSLRQGVEITAPGGLSLSGTNASGPVGGASGSPSGRNAAERRSWLFEIAKMHQPDAAAFARANHRLLEAAYKAAPANQSRARLRLAQLYFAHSRFSDAAGILQVIEADEPEFVDDPVFRALRGASYFFRGDLKRAHRDLFHANLDPYSEISLWRGAVEAADHNWAAASRLFARTETIIGVYPRHLRIRFGLLAAETALHVGDIALAKYHLETVRALKPGRSFRPRIDFLQGQLYALTLDPEGAVESWTRAAAGPDPKYRVQALLARTQMLLKLQKIGLQDASKELEKLRYMWRGDELEFRVLKQLGEAYLRAGDFKRGLPALRDAVRYYPKHPEADGVIDHMRAAFVKLYVGGKADELRPLVSLALYDEFRELTPPGKVGSDLIAKLARRLVGVDLLDRSARLLKHLVDERLTGTERLEAANQLGLVYLLDRKPDMALATLGGDLPADLAPKIAVTRRHLRARALAELVRFKEALALLSGDKTRNAELLRAEINWRLKDWAAAANAYQALVGLTPAKDAAVSDTRHRYVLSLAISLALSGDVQRLDAVRGTHAEEMAKSRYREAFNLVSGHSGPVPSDYKVITRKVAEVDLFQTFMKTYREKLLRAPGTAVRSKEKAQPAKG